MSQSFRLRTLIVLDNQENLAAYLLAAQAYFLGRTRDPAAGQVFLERALALLRQAEVPDRRVEGFILICLAWVIDLQGKEGALAYVDPTLAVLAETGDHRAEVFLLILWGNTVRFIQPLEADKIYRGGLAVCHESGDRNMVGYMNQMRSTVNISLGHYTKAQEVIDEAIAIFEDMGNVLGVGYALARQGELAITLSEY